MIFARPPEGFRWVETPHAQKQLDEAFTQYPDLKSHWMGIRKRLIFTGHREGEIASAALESNAYIFSVELYKLPTLQLLYTILGETLTVQSVRLKHKR